MGEYTGLLSEIYDIIHHNQMDVDAYLKIAKTYAGRILELGSGTGRLSVELAKEGYDITCLEIHRDMISIHTKKLNEETSTNTKIVLGDMCSFDLEEKFDLIIAPCNVVNHLMHKDDFLRMLASVKKHLSDIGMFVIDNSQPNFEIMKDAHGKEEIYKLKNPLNNNDIVDQFTPFYNFDEQIERSKIIATEYENEGIKRRVEIMSELKFWYADDIRNFLREAGFSIILESGSLNNIEELTEDSKEMIFYIKVR